MQKSVYSIVLSDDVVSAIDRLAYTKCTSRSNMINQILAEYVSYVTPEKRLSDIFTRMAAMIDSVDQLQVMLGASDTMMSIKSALSYKYNPTVRYSVELYKSDPALGELRISLRTQSAGLIALMNDFYARWDQVEREQLSREVRSSVRDGKYARLLDKSENADGDELADALVAYVETMDSAMKGYFSDRRNGVEPTARIRAYYQQYESKSPVLL